jgi:PEP-CTERM motif
MTFQARLLFGLALLFLLSIAPARANRIDKGSSNYGDTDPNCATLTTNCQTTSQLANTVAGNPVFSFTFVSGFDVPAETLFAFQIPDTITPGSVLTLTFPSLAGLTYGSLYCDNTTDPTHALDAGGNVMKDTGTGNAMPCTPALLPADPNHFFTEVDNGNSAAFTFNNVSDLPSSFTFFTDSLTDLPTDVKFVPGTVTAPEPSSILMLGSGLLALCGGLRRRSKNASAA